MDRQSRSRLGLYAAVLVLFVLAALQPTTAAILQKSVFIPAGFAAVAVFLLGLPFVAMGHAEGERVGWKRALDFLQHNSLLAFLDLMLLWTTGFIAMMGLSDMAIAEKVLFVLAVVAGSFFALRDWFLSQQSDRKQRTWQDHPH